MSGLTEEGRAAVEAIARRHGVGADAARALLEALRRGGGAQAQFSHPELGGMGQWSRGGMIMVGDMFNSGLKTRVDALCTELADLVGNKSMFVAGANRLGGDWPSEGWPSEGWHGESWWPEDLGAPSTSGSQNDMRYAFFPQTRRLAIARGGHVDVYDTGAHHIHGASQQQGVGQDLAFTSQLGTVALHELSRVGAGHAAHRESTHVATSGIGGVQTQSQSQSGQSQGARSQSGSHAWREAPPRPSTPPAAAPREAPRPEARAAGEDDVFAKIERLHELQRKGVLTDAEFAEKKKELLARI